MSGLPGDAKTPGDVLPGGPRRTRAGHPFGGELDGEAFNGSDVVEALEGIDTRRHVSHDLVEGDTKFVGSILRHVRHHTSTHG